MKKSVLAIAAVVVGVASGPALAQSKKDTDCTYQAAVVSAVRDARLARVNERNVPNFAKTRATWPESYNSAIPLVTPWVYEMKMRDVKAQDLGAAWKEMCLAQ